MKYISRVSKNSIVSSTVEFKKSCSTYTIQYDTEIEQRYGPPQTHTHSLLSISDKTNALETLEGVEKLFQEYKGMNFEGNRSYAILLKNVTTNVLNIIRNKKTNTYFYIAEYSIGITSEVKFYKDEMGRLHRLDGPAIDPVNPELNVLYPFRYFICGAPYTHGEYLDTLFVLGLNHKKEKDVE